MSLPEKPLSSPQTLEATAPRWLSSEEREQVGAALDMVIAAESAVRHTWAALASCWPATSGTRKRILILTHRAEALVEGPRSRLGRAVRSAPRPWSLDEAPLVGVLEQARALEREGTELAGVVERSRALQDELRHLRERYARELPRAWERMLARRGVSEEAIDLAHSAEELDVFAFWVRRARDDLAAWDSDVRAWLTKAGDGAHPEEIDAAAGALPPLAALETRYELLLMIGAMDREPALRRNAAELRSVVRRHLDVLASTARLGAEDAILRCAREYSESQTSATVSAEEAWTYAEALAHYGRLRIERSRDG